MIAALLVAMALSGCDESSAAADCKFPLATLHKGDTLAFEGDSLVYGFDATPNGQRPAINLSSFARSRDPIPETLQSLLGDGVAVANHGYPGDRSIDGIERWKGSRTATWTLIMFGTNDLGNFGNRPGGPIAVDGFEAHLRRLAERRLTTGGKVVLLSPPPLQDKAADARLDPYREAIRTVAQDIGACYLDMSKVLVAVDPKWTDGIHLSRKSNRRIADYLKRAFAFE